MDPRPGCQRGDLAPASISVSMNGTDSVLPARRSTGCGSVKFAATSPSLAAAPAVAAAAS